MSSTPVSDKLLIELMSPDVRVTDDRRVQIMEQVRKLRRMEAACSTNTRYTRPKPNKLVCETEVPTNVERDRETSPPSAPTE